MTLFKVSEADPETCVPFVGDYKVATVISMKSITDDLLLELQLRKDFMPLNNDEEEFLLAQASGIQAEGEKTGYIGKGIYRHTLS